MNNTERAAKLFAAIKKELSARQKANKGPATKGKCYQSVNIQWDEGFNGKNAYIEVYRSLSAKGSFRISDMSESDMYAVFRELMRRLDGLKKTRGWGGLYYVHPGQRYSGTLLRNLIQGVGVADAPCAEFKSLQNWVNKYGTGAKVLAYDLYTVGMGGKRGYLWDEEGERCYLDNAPQKCKRLLEKLRAARSSKDTVTCKRSRENYIDPIDRDYSEKYEIECDGEHREMIHVTVKTPTGRLKYETSLC